MAKCDNDAVELLSNVFEKSSERLGKALIGLDYPNGGRRNSILHENNLIIHIAHELIERGFHCYAEAAVGKGSIDLIAGDGKLAVAIEAKMFGDPRERACGIKRDLERMGKFVPHRDPLSQLNNPTRACQWWAAAQERWGVIVIGHQRAGDEVIETAWTTPDDEDAARLIKQGNKSRHRDTTIEQITESFIALRKTLRDKGAHFGAKEICDDTPWPGTDGAWLLWAAFRLD